MRHSTYNEPGFSRFMFESTKSSVLWLLVRLYVGWEWLYAGWEKFQSPMWFGKEAGKPLIGFIMGALGKTTGAHPDVYQWYATFLHDYVLPNAGLWSNMVTLGEMLVGIALILGFFVGISAFFGALMNFNYLLAGTVSVNPTFFLLGVLLILGRHVAGYIGLDYYVLPWFYKMQKKFHKEL